MKPGALFRISAVVMCLPFLILGFLARIAWFGASGGWEAFDRLWHRTGGGK